MSKQQQSTTTAAAAPPKRKLVIQKRSEMTTAEIEAPAPPIKTTQRQRFRDMISPFLLSIHIRCPGTPEYHIEGEYFPAIEGREPISLYTWLDSKLSDTITSAFEQKHPFFPDEWNTLTISSLYVLRQKVEKQLILEIGPEGYKSKLAPTNHLGMTLYDLKIEIGDHLEFSFE